VPDAAKGASSKSSMTMVRAILPSPVTVSLDQKIQFFSLSRDMLKAYHPTDFDLLVMARLHILITEWQI
jgi:hypothetical protein